MRHFLAFFFAIALAGMDAHACSCVELSEAQHFSQAEIVAVGLVRGSHWVNDSKELGGGHVAVTVDIRERFKGPAVKTVVVSDQLAESGMCFAGLTPGVEFVFYLDRSRDASRCSGTRRFTATVADRAAKLQEIESLKRRAQSKPLNR